MSSADTSFLRRLLPAGRTTPRRPIESLKTLAIVVPLTAMIWVYAENAQRRSEDMRVRVQFVTSNANSAATVPGSFNDDGPELQITMDGPRGQIEKFKQTIADNTADGRLKLALPGNNEQGNRSVNIADAFKFDPHYYGINVVVKSTPSDLPVTVEPLDTKDLPIAPPEGLSVTLQNVSFNPARVRVTGPLSAIQREYGSENQHLLVDATSLQDLPSSGPGGKPKQVSLVQPKNSRVRLAQSSVEMTYEVVSTNLNGEIRSVFIDVRRPAADDGRSRVIIRGGPVIPNVNVTGPANSVSKIIGNNPSQSVKAVLEVTREDVDKGEFRREVKPDFSTIDPNIKPIGTYEVTFEVKSVTPAENDR
jgi:hypothetical protein